MTIFDVRPEEVKSLSDSDLRELVARLSTAEVRASGHPVTSVTFGGAQEAKDGGIDVRVDCAANLNLGALPSGQTGFQVKKPDLGPAAIVKEMRPKGALRDSIRLLAASAGAYIIASGGSVSDSALRTRRKAMRDALHDLANPESLRTDFFDASRLAAWANAHPGVAVWVKQRSGNGTRGWRPLESWSAPAEGLEADYILDDQGRLHDGPALDPRGGLSLIEGLSRLRQNLSRRGKAVRLLGLSGMGKTRLAQALFDPRIGENALDAGLAIYADIADEPDPNPRELARMLVAGNYRAILIVDNCPPDIHRALRATVGQVDSTVSLLTIEYDIRDDQPEDTEVFRLEPSSSDVLSALVRRRWPSINEHDARRIADFAGGNARVGLALASSSEKSGSIARLSDSELFERLFRQRNETDQSLLRAAEAVSLVYSFNGEDTHDGSELEILARLAGQTTADLFRNVAELRARDLVQKRGKWRAVLPQALANRLAARALARIDRSALHRNLVEDAPGRLFKSFTRRLGLLHDTPEAVVIVSKWMVEGGMLADMTTLNGLGLQALLNVAPVCPGATLGVLERGATLGIFSRRHLGDGLVSRDTFSRLIRDIAYEDEHFERAISLLVGMMEITGERNPNSDSSRRRFEALFHVRFSGTTALPATRRRVANQLLLSDDDGQRWAGLSAATALLETHRLGGDIATDFGARPRTYGWYPKDTEEVADWFGSALELLAKLALDDGELGEAAKKELARRFKGLWSIDSLQVSLVAAFQRVRADGFWPDGWIAIKNTIRKKSDNQGEVSNHRLSALEEAMRPKSLAERIRAFAFSEVWSAMDIAESMDGEDTEARPTKRFDEVVLLVSELGKALADDSETLAELLPELVTVNGGRLIALGKGFGEAAANPREVWAKLRQAYGEADASKRHIEVLRSFLAGVGSHNPAFQSEALDHAVTDPELAQQFPFLQASVDIDAAGVERLLMSLDVGVAQAQHYQWLAFGRVGETIPNQALATILSRIGQMPDGLVVAVRILSMRFYDCEDYVKSPGSPLVRAGQEMLRAWEFGRAQQRLDHEVAGLIRVCLSTSDDGPVAGEMSANLLKSEGYFWEWDEAVAALCETQTNAVLDVLLSPDSAAEGASILTNWSIRQRPLDNVASEALLEWVAADRERSIRLAQAISIFRSTSGTVLPDEEAGPVSLSSIAIELVRTANDRIAILDVYADRLMPSSWSGSLADILEKRSNALQGLVELGDEAVTDWVAQQTISLAEQVVYWREQESRPSEPSFE